MSDADQPADAPTVAFKPRARRGNVRKRVRDEEEATPDPTQVVRTTKAARKPSAIAATTAQETARDAPGLVKSSREATAHQYGGGATALLETETEHDKDARAIAERSVALNESEQVDDTSVYRGQAGYKSYVARDKEQVGSLNKITGTQGPIRAPVFIRSSIRFDYQPDICKDYKETGFCGFGDSCKFMHDRGDYKTGWQLEREWDEMQRKRQERIMRGLEPDEEQKQEELPFACHICRQSFQRPVVTKCNHYFCEACILRHYRTSPKCPICGKDTEGVFNQAKKLVARLQAAKLTGGQAEGDAGEGAAAAAEAAAGADDAPADASAAETDAGGWTVVQ